MKLCREPLVDKTRLVAWDTELTTSAGMIQVLRQVRAASNAHGITLICVCRPDQVSEVHAGMDQVQFVDRHIWTWHKVNQNWQGYENYVYASETMVIGYQGGRRSCFAQSPSNPLDRHNVQWWPAVKTLRTDVTGIPINRTQKRSALLRYFARMHCRTGQWALVLGSGTGADVLGALSAGISCIGVERDERQFRSSVQWLEESCSYHAERIPKGTKEAALIMKSDVVHNPNHATRCLLPDVRAAALAEMEKTKEAEDAKDDEALPNANCIGCGDPLVSPETTWACASCAVPCHQACSSVSSGFYFCSPQCGKDHNGEAPKRPEHYCPFPALSAENQPFTFCGPGKKAQLDKGDE